MKTHLLLFFFVLNIYNCIQAQKFDSNYTKNNDTAIVDRKKTEQLEEKKEFNIWLVLLETSILPLTSALLASLFSFGISNLHNSRKKKKEELQNYLLILTTTRNELEFYLEKLRQLKSDAEKIINYIQLGKKAIIPTYSLYPNFLENSKISLNQCYKNPNIVKRVGHCHFELSHICERLELMKVELRSNFVTEIQVANINGFKELVISNIKEFENIIIDINFELLNMSK